MPGGSVGGVAGQAGGASCCVTVMPGGGVAGGDSCCCVTVMPGGGVAGGAGCVMPGGGVASAGGAGCCVIGGVAGAGGAGCCVVGGLAGCRCVLASTYQGGCTGTGENSCGWP